MPWTPPPDIEVKCWFCGHMTLLPEMHEACRRKVDHYRDVFNQKLALYTKVRRQKDPEWGMKRRKVLATKATAKIDDSKVVLIKKKPKPEDKSK